VFGAALTAIMKKLLWTLAMLVLLLMPLMGYSPSTALADYLVHFEQHRHAGRPTAAMAVSKHRLVCGLTLLVCLAG
jgi:hypothetical protein